MAPRVGEREEDKRERERERGRGRRGRKRGEREREVVRKKVAGTLKDSLPNSVLSR